MPKRTPQNCGIIKKLGEPGKDGNGLCMGFAKSKTDDEPIEACKICKYCTSNESIRI